MDLDYYDIEWFALETNRDHSVVFEIASKYFIITSSDSKSTPLVIWLWDMGLLDDEVLEPLRQNRRKTEKMNQKFITGAFLPKFFILVAAINKNS